MAKISRQGLAQLLIKAERQQAASADTSPWPEYYADVLIEG